MLGGDTGAPATSRAAPTHLGKYRSCMRRRMLIKYKYPIVNKYKSPNENKYKSPLATRRAAPTHLGKYRSCMRRRMINFFNSLFYTDLCTTLRDECPVSFG